MFNIIDRYIAKLFLAFFLGGMAVFIVLFISVDFMTNISRYGASGGAVTRYYLLFAPGIAYQMMAGANKR